MEELVSDCQIDHIFDPKTYPKTYHLFLGITSQKSEHREWGSDSEKTETSHRWNGVLRKGWCLRSDYCQRLDRRGVQSVEAIHSSGTLLSIDYNGWSLLIIVRLLTCRTSKPSNWRVECEANTELVSNFSLHSPKSIATDDQTRHIAWLEWPKQILSLFKYLYAFYLLVLIVLIVSLYIYL